MAAAAGAAGSPALGGPAPRGTRPAPPHPAPSGGRWQHSPERAQSPGGWLGPGGQHCCGRDLLAVDLPSVHVLECLRSLFRILELHVGMALRRMRVHPFSAQVDLSTAPEGGEYFLDVLPGHLPREPRYMHFGGLRGGAAPSPFLLVLSGWFGFGTRPPPVISGAPRPRRAGRADSCFNR